MCSGGYEYSEVGGDTYSHTVYPVDDEYEALDILSALGSFTREFKNVLENGMYTLEIVVYMDKMETTKNIK